jgi:predicted transcriptional regulator
MAAVLLILPAGCAQVPKQSVELTETVGRDLGELHRSHRQLANLLYDRMERDVNRFIDEVYLPYQVQNTLADDEIYRPLVDAIEKAKESDPTGEKQKRAIAFLSTYLEDLRAEVEDYRREKLAPLKAQRAELVRSIDEAYTRVRQGQAITAGYLASVAKVTEAQNELLARLGLPDLQPQIVSGATRLADEVEKLRGQAGKADKTLDKIGEIIEKFNKATEPKAPVAPQQ